MPKYVQQLRVLLMAGDAADAASLADCLQCETMAPFVEGNLGTQVSGRAHTRLMRLQRDEKSGKDLQEA